MARKFSVEITVATWEDGSIVESDDGTTLGTFETEDEALASF